MKKTFAVIPLSFAATAAMLYGLGQFLEIGQRETPTEAIAESPLPEAKPALITPSPHWKVQEKKLQPLYPIDGEKAGGCCQPNLGLDEQLWGENGDKAELLQAIDRSLSYLNSKAAATVYQNYPIAEITRERVLKSLQRFRQLVLTAQSAAELQAAVKREFSFYQAIGIGPVRKGEVLFTAYFEPIYPASRDRTPEYPYPLFRRPPNLDTWKRPHPPRGELEGKDGLTVHPKLKGLELFWLRDRWQAYTIHIQGSARLQLTDGTETSVGYAGNIRRDYTSVGKELVEDGKMTLEEATMQGIEAYFKQNPGAMNEYVPRDRSFVFFGETHGKPASGSIGVTLSQERSIATDKSLMPPGALALLHAPIPFVKTPGVLEERIISRYVLDQDTGGAIQGPGRVDYFLGAGPEAGDRAGVTRHLGQLYYLLLKEPQRSS